MELMKLQQHFAYRANVSYLLPLRLMSRAETRAKTRRDNLAKLKANYKTNAALSEALEDGFSPSFISQLLSGHRGIGDDVADKIEERLNLPAGYLDAEPIAEPVQLSPGDQQTLAWAHHLPPSELTGLIQRAERERDSAWNEYGSKDMLVRSLKAIERDGEQIEPPPAPPKEPPPTKPRGSQYELPEPGVARPHAGHHKKRVA